MQETFIELVPRSASSLCEEMRQVEQMDISFQGYNLPELKRQKSSFLSPEHMMQMRKKAELSPEKKLALHLRTQERNVVENIERVRLMAMHGVDIALLVTGDAFDPGEEPATCAHNVLDGITVPMGGIEIAVGADLYMKQWGRWGHKIPAIQKGIVGSTFTQPIFHPQTLASLHENIGNFLPEKVYAGITWISNAKSREYWHRKNNVPAEFLPSGESDETIRYNSISQSADILRLVRQQGFSQYVMLMSGRLEELQQIFSLSENIREH